MMFAPDGETIDKWWRNVSESSLASQVKRISPDFYSLTAFVGGPNNMFEIPWKFVPSMDAETSWFLISDYNNKLAMPYVQPSRVDVRSGDS
jgi:hypothetical protein